MKQLMTFFVVLAFAMAASAENLPASKAGARTTATTVISCDSADESPDPGCGTQWKTIATLDIKAPGNGKELLVGVSAQTVLKTLTGVASKGGQKATSSADAGIQVRVVMDPATAGEGAGGTVASPGKVVYDRRLQVLSAVLEGQIAACLSIVDGQIVLDEDCVLAEGVELFLNTAGAHHFNFVLANVSQGIHKIEVQARARVLDQACDTDTTGSQATCVANAQAFIRKLAMTVEQVMFVKDLVVEF